MSWLFMTWSWSRLVQDLLMICSWRVTCSWFVHNFFMNGSFFFHVSSMTCYLLHHFTLPTLFELLHLHYLTWNTSLYLLLLNLFYLIISIELLQAILPEILLLNIFTHTSPLQLLRLIFLTCINLLFTFKKLWFYQD